MFALDVYICCERGLVRDCNEDSFVAGQIYKGWEEVEGLEVKGLLLPQLLGVFDGMGGEWAGGEASFLAARLAAEYGCQFIDGVGNVSFASEYVHRCHEAMKCLAEEKKVRRVGAAFAMALLRGVKFRAFSMGDCRIYLFREGKLLLLTKDHTLAQKMYEANLMTWEEMIESPNRHVLIKYLGMDEASPSRGPEEYPPLSLQEGDRFLFCTDGLHHLVEPEEIKWAMQGEMSVACQALRQMVYERGGDDNLTCMAVLVRRA